MNCHETSPTLICYLYKYMQENLDLFLLLSKKLLKFISITIFLLCFMLYTGGNHKGITALFDSTCTVSILILFFIRKLPCGLKCVHSQPRNKGL